MKKFIGLFVGLLWVAVAFAMPASAAKTPSAVNVTIDISSQTMTVSVGGWPSYRWKVSTARSGYWTPRGHFRPFALRKVYYSRKYDNAPMPNSVFFHGGYAIHGTGHIRSLGRPASHGCVRLAPGNAATLFNLVRKYGMGSTRITIVD
jgi:lipoprotein-anchoring transpeptidase ErfK/SrfK